MRLLRGRNLCSSRSSSWFTLLSVSYILLLLLTVSGVEAQTNTPGVSTGVPGATATLPPGLTEQLIRLDFRQSDQGFTEALGSWSLGNGWLPNGSDVLTISGNGNEYVVSRVTVGYTSTAVGDFNLTGYYGATTPFPTEQIELPACPAGCVSQSFDFGGSVIDIFDITIGSFVDGELWFLDIYAWTGGANPDYELDGDCPILTAEEIELLDPLYYAQCARCFITPTPVRDSAIATDVPLTVQPTLDGTLEGTFVIPIILPDGTQQTPTPRLTALPTDGPTLTPSATATPITTGIKVTFGSDTWPYTFQVPVGLQPLIPAASVDASTGSVAAPSGKGVQYLYFSSGSGCQASGVAFRIRIEFPQGTVSAIRWRQKNSFYPNTLISTTLFNAAGTQVHSAAIAVASTQGAWSGTLTRSVSPVAAVALELQASQALCGQTLRTLHLDDIEVVFNTPPATYTPVPTNPPGSTAAPPDVGQPWINTPAPFGGTCETAVWRDNDPVVDFDPEFNVVDYGCYTIVPEISITIVEPDATIDGLSLCVTWFQLPIISAFGIVATLDWVLLGVGAWFLMLIMKL